MEDENQEHNADTQAATTDTKENSKVENKNEGEKANKPSKSANGSITFENQEQLDGFIDRLFAKKKENENTKSNTVEPTKKDVEQEEAKTTTENNSTVDFSTEIALSMAEAGIDATKTRRLSKLVDQSKCVVNGVLDAEKLKSEIEAITSEFPEFKAKDNNSNEQDADKKQGFKFGAAGQQNDPQSQTGAGPKKRWNKFNY